MSTHDDDIKHDLEILQALDKAIEQGPWEYNLFFKAIGKRLIEVRERFKKELNLSQEEIAVATGVPTRIANRIAQRSGLIEVFVSLYNADGDNISKWESILSNISSHSINRPTYQAETQAKASIRAAVNKRNEAYASVYIRNGDILTVDPRNVPIDRYGNQILLIKENAMRRENITYFMHVSGRYEFENNKLVRLGSADFL